MTKAYSYIRFSTPEQAKGDSYRRQMEEAQRYAAANGLELDTSLTFEDVGVSAYRAFNSEAGRLAAFVEAIDAGEVPKGSVLLVESLDRISRAAARRAVHVLDDIVDRDVEVVTLTDGRVYNKRNMDRDPLTLMVAVLTFIRANEESETKSRRVRAAREAGRLAAREGKRKVLTAKCPAWLVAKPDRSGFEVLPERAAVVRRIYELASNGVGQHSIAQTLNSEKVPAFGGPRSTRWHVSYIVKLLETDAVVGTFVPHTVEYLEGKKIRKPSEPIDGYFPAVVDPALNARVKALRSSANPLRGRHAGGEIKNILAGLGRCPVCDGTMTRVAKGSRSRPVLVCEAAKSKAACTYRSVPLEKVENGVLRALEGEMEVPAPGTKGADLDAKIHDLDNRIMGLEAAQDHLLDALRSGRQSVSLSEELRRVEDESEIIRSQRRELIAKKAVMVGGLLQKRLDRLTSAAQQDAPNVPEINKTMRECLDKVVVDYTDELLEFHWKHGGVSWASYRGFDRVRGGYVHSEAE